MDASAADGVSTIPATPYGQWVGGEGLAVLDASAIPDLRAVELKPWARRGGRGVFILHALTVSSSDCYVCEILPGKSLAPQRQLFEEIIFVLDGRGSTGVRNAAGETLSFEWHAGALFTVAPNAVYQHFNGSGRQSARFVAVTTAPLVMNALHDPANAFDSRPDSNDPRGDVRPGTLSASVSAATHLDTSFLLDAVNCPLLADAARGAGGYLSLRLGGGNMTCLITQLAPATYGNAYIEEPSTHTIILAGEGYSLAWPEGGERVRSRWQNGSLMVAPSAPWRQHFNCGRQPARLLTIAPEIGNSRGLGSPHMS